MKSLKSNIHAVIALSMLCVSLTNAGAKAPASRLDEQPTVSDQICDRWVVILGTSKDFKEAKADAQKWSKSSGVPFSMNGMIFDRKGLRLPDDDSDEMWAGCYFLRRHNMTSTGTFSEQHISIEKSEAYDGFAKGYYMIVGHIAETAHEAEKMAAFFKPHAQTTDVKKARIYMGCMH